MTTSNRVVGAPFGHPALFRLFMGVVVFALVLGHFLLGAAQVGFPSIRESIASHYVGVPTWFFALFGIYQIVIAVLLFRSGSRVAGAMHAGAISVAAIGFALLGVETLSLIPINLAVATAAFGVALYYRNS